MSGRRCGKCGDNPLRCNSHRGGTRRYGACRASCCTDWTIRRRLPSLGLWGRLAAVPAADAAPQPKHVIGRRLQVAAQARHIDRASGQEREEEGLVHRRLQDSLATLRIGSRSLNETQVQSPKLCFLADSYLVYETRRDSLASKARLDTNYFICTFNRFP